MVEIHLRHGEASPQSGRLTDRGKEQAKAASVYLRREFPRTFGFGVHSSATRAADTAQILGLASVNWTVDNRLREMAWGTAGFPPNYEQLVSSRAYQSFAWRNPPDGESWQEVVRRVGEVCHQVSKLYQDQDRLLVYHGNAMHGMRAYREKLTRNQFPRLFEAPYKYFNNCQLIIYTDEDPQTGEIRPEMLWVKSVCPWAEGKFGHDWVLVGKTK